MYNININIKFNTSFVGKPNVKTADTAIKILIFTW